MSEMTPLGPLVSTNPMMDKFVVKYELPTEAFVEYEESDRAWLRYFGLLKRVETDQPLIIQIGREFVMHPETWAIVRARIRGETV